MLYVEAKDGKRDVFFGWSNLFNDWVFCIVTHPDAGSTQEFELVLDGKDGLTAGDVRELVLEHADKSDLVHTLSLGQDYRDEWQRLKLGCPG